MGTYIALTGGIAAGKSTVARRFAERGAVVIDADRLAREAVRPGSAALRALGRHFGTEVIGADGSLDRAAVAARVFGDEQQLAALNAIVHPAVRTLVDAARRRAFDDDQDAVVVYDIPLMTAADAAGYDAVVVVDAPADQRLRRLIDARGMTRADARRRIESQPPASDLLAVADAVVDSSGTLAQTIRRADEVWDVVVGRRSP
jgi:dephospho-CoA kinase